MQRVTMETGGYVVAGRDKGEAQAELYWTGKTWSSEVSEAMPMKDWSARMAVGMLEQDYPWMVIYPAKRSVPKQDWSPRRTPWMGAVRREPERDWRIPASVNPELPDAEARAHEAGAPDVLDLIGVGMYGIVFCDERGHAWKVGRLEKPSSDRSWIREALADEYEWLRDAKATSIDKNVAQAYAYHQGPVVLERECVSGRPGGWNDERKLHELHGRIEKVMLKNGWNAPEFKADSYIFRNDGTPVLVDASSALRVGENLARFVEDALEGRRKTRETWSTLAFYLLREMHEKTVPPARALPLLDRLVERDPEIRKSFSW